MLSRHPDGAGARLLRQECGIGLVPIEALDTPAGRLLRMTQAAPTYRDAGLARAVVARMLGCAEADLAATPIEVVSTAAPWLIVQLTRFAAISTLAPEQGLIVRECAALGAGRVTVFAERGDGGPIRLRVRSFAPGEGIAEDPVCGSGNGAVAAYLARHRHGAEAAGGYVAEQGIELGRDGDALRVTIGGAAVTVASGRLHL